MCSGVIQRSPIVASTCTTAKNSSAFLSLEIVERVEISEEARREGDQEPDFGFEIDHSRRAPSVRSSERSSQKQTGGQAHACPPPSEPSIFLVPSRVIVLRRLLQA